MAEVDRTKYLSDLDAAYVRVQAKREEMQTNTTFQLSPDELKIERKWYREQMDAVEKFAHSRSHADLVAVLRELYDRGVV